jgi:hypothetical protein
MTEYRVVYKDTVVAESPEEAIAKAGEAVRRDPSLFVTYATARINTRKS